MDVRHENLPAVPEPDDLEEKIFDGEVVDEPEPPQRPAVVVLRPAVQIVNVVNIVVRHEHTKRSARHAGYAALGAYVLLKRWRESRTTARYERYIRAAEAGGNHDAALEWDQRRAEFLKARHERRMQRTASRLAVVLAMPKILLGLVIVLAVLGVLLAVAERRIGAVADPVLWLAAAVRLAVIVTAAVWTPVLLSAAAVLLGVLWHLGRTHAAGMTGGWLAAPAKDTGDAGMVVTADTIVLALQNLPIPELKKAFKDGWRPSFTLTPVRDGRGYEAEFSVPLGVTPEMIADKRPVLARNLHREEIETWPSAGSPGNARLWVADRGAIGKAAPEYPLLHEGQADVFEGVPGGVLARGDGALIPVVGNNGVLGGMMGQGKSNGARVVVLGCCTDPLCGVDVFVFANNGDFDAYEPRLATYRKGLDDDVIEAAVEQLHEAYADVAAREAMLADIGAKKVTRAVAERYPELRPRVSLFSECHELFGHPEYGELAGELAVKTAKRARKTGRVLWFDTQSSRKSAIPPALVELVSVNCCFAVKSWRSNDGFLGDGSFAAGIRATELRPGRDRGTSLVTGISDAQFELLKWYFVEVDDDTGYDAAAEVIARCMQSVAPGTPTGNSPQVLEVRDLLDDLQAVIDGPWRVNVNDLPDRLRRIAPTWPAYRKLTGKQLRAMLGDQGVRTTNTDNRPELDPADLQAVIARRDRMSELQ